MPSPIEAGDIVTWAESGVWDSIHGKGPFRVVRVAGKDVVIVTELDGRIPKGTIDICLDGLYLDIGRMRKDEFRSALEQAKKQHAKA